MPDEVYVSLDDFPVSNYYYWKPMRHPDIYWYPVLAGKKKTGFVILRLVTPTCAPV